MIGRARTMLSAAIVGTWLCGGTAADDGAASLAGAMLGFLWHEPATQVLPVRGTTGSATIGAPLDFGFDVSRAVPLDDRHLLLAATSPATLLTIDTSRPRDLRVIPEASIAPALSAVSPAGSAAALYDAGRRVMLLVTGLPREPRVAAALDLAHVDLPITEVAVNDAGTLLVYAVEGAALASVYAWSSALDSRLLLDLEGISAMALAGDDLVIAGAGTPELLVIRDVPGAGRRERFASAPQGFASVTGMAIAGNRVVVADAGARAVVIFDLRGRLLGRVACSCVPTGLYRLQTAVYRLTDDPGRTMYVLDARAGAARVSFVPPAPPLSGSRR